MTTNEIMTNLLDIPPELIAKILEHLTPDDIVSVSESCQGLYRASQVDSVWKRRCIRDYGIKTAKTLEVTYKQLYTKLLHPYGKLIGLWQSDIATYGGLLQIQYKDGRLLGKELHPPHDPKITEPLRIRPLFSASIDQNGTLLVLCLVPCRYGLFSCTQEQPDNATQSHSAIIGLKGSDHFAFKCCDHTKHSHPKGKHQEFLHWMRDESDQPFGHGDMTDSHELLMMKFLLLRQYNCQYQYHRLALPNKISGVPIQPGLFKGTYAAHGLELVLLDYEEKETLVKAVKVTGDPNVPAGERTFHANLNFPMTLTAEDQDTISTLAAIQAAEVTFRKTEGKPESQPFRVPRDCYERFSDIPRSCVSRYHGWGQIAGHGFSNPSFSQGHWVIFSEDLFAFIWLDLASIGVYHRVQEFSCL